VVPTDLVTRVDLDRAYPPFLEKELDLLARCRARGHDYYLVSLFRDPREQEEKFAQGRFGNPGKIITKARGGFSLHNYGIGADHAEDKDLQKPGLQPEWADPTTYAVLKAEGESVGLQVGVPSVPGGDPGHVQLALSKHLGRKEYGILLELRGLYLEGRTEKDSLARVWKQLDAWGFDS
jgi:hypothetical protein